MFFCKAKLDELNSRVEGVKGRIPEPEQSAPISFIALTFNSSDVAGRPAASQAAPQLPSVEEPPSSHSSSGQLHVAGVVQ